MTEEKFAKTKHYKINGKHFHCKNQLPGCPSWLQFKLLIDLIFEPVHPERRRSLPLSLLAKPVDSIIRQRANSIMCRWKLNNYFSTIQPLPVCEVFSNSRSLTVRGVMLMCRVTSLTTCILYKNI